VALYTLKYGKPSEHSIVFFRQKYQNSFLLLVVDDLDKYLHVVEVSSSLRAGYY